MELEEAKKILMGLPEYQDLVSKEFEAIDTVLQALETLQEENEKYRSGELLTANQVKSFEETTKKYYIHKDKIKEKLEEQIKRIDKLLDEMIDKSIGAINVSGLNKKEREQVIAKRNGLLVQKVTLQQVLEELLKGE
jgi:hypothetical protein